LENRGRSNATHKTREKSLEYATSAQIESVEREEGVAEKWKKIKALTSKKVLGRKQLLDEWFMGRKEL